jgi:hypothetical protein
MAGSPLEAVKSTATTRLISQPPAMNYYKINSAIDNTALGLELDHARSKDSKAQDSAKNVCNFRMKGYVAYIAEGGVLLNVTAGGVQSAVVHVLRAFLGLLDGIYNVDALAIAADQGPTAEAGAEVVTQSKTQKAQSLGTKKASSRAFGAQTYSTVQYTV